MDTIITKTDIQPLAEAIQNGELVAVPTETVYGLAANAMNESAVQQIYDIKGRPEVKPLSIMISGPEDMDRYATDIPDAARKMARQFWPGPLTIVLKSSQDIPEIVRAGGETIGLRCPNNKKTLELIRTSGVPLAAPSANPSGEESPKTAEAVKGYFDGHIAGILDDGECELGVESTIIDMSKMPYQILREGALTQDVIEDLLLEDLTIVGITGNTGSGKTTALEVLDGMGAGIIDCDKLYHEMLESDYTMISDIQEFFPETVQDFKVDRKKLGEIVFSDEQSLLTLNAITHRHIGRQVRKQLRQFAMAGRAIAAVDAIALIESRIAEECDVVVGVIADPDIRVQRIIQRDGISEDRAWMRIKAQKPEDYFRENCDYILENNGSENEFKEQCEELFAEVI